MDMYSEVDGETGAVKCIHCGEIVGYAYVMHGPFTLVCKDCWVPSETT